MNTHKPAKESEQRTETGFEMVRQTRIELQQAGLQKDEIFAIFITLAIESYGKLTMTKYKDAKKLLGMWLIGNYKC